MHVLPHLNLHHQRSQTKTTSTTTITTHTMLNRCMYMMVLLLSIQRDRYQWSSTCMFCDQLTWEKPIQERVDQFSFKAIKTQSSNNDKTFKNHQELHWCVEICHQINCFLSLSLVASSLGSHTTLRIYSKSTCCGLVNNDSHNTKLLSIIT